MDFTSRRRDTVSRRAGGQCPALSAARRATNWRPRRVAFDGEMARTKDGVEWRVNCVGKRSGAGLR